jgi:hypothetical protein
MSKKGPHNLKKFTYGHQFEPDKLNFLGYLKLIKTCANKRSDLEQEIRKQFFSSHSNTTINKTTEDNQAKLAMNCFLSLRSYGLIETDPLKPKEYIITKLSIDLLNMNTPDEQIREFAKHILVNLCGTDLLKAIESVNERGMRPTLGAIIAELNEMGYVLSKNSVYPSTMRQWLTLAGLFEGKYKIAWDLFYELTEIDKDFIDALYRLTPEQKYFLISLLELQVTTFQGWPKILEHTSMTKHLDYDMKMFPAKVLDPLNALGIIEFSKTTDGRGAKPNKVRLTKKGESDYLIPFLRGIANLVSLDETELNKPLSTVLNEVLSEDIHVKGKALELLAVWMVRLCSLRFTEWRKRDAETGKGEVDLMAASDTFVYSRWQIQCKNTAIVDVDVVAKEIGMTFLTQADVVMIVTTGRFTTDAIQYADSICAKTRYYIILINGDHLEQFKTDSSKVVPVLNRIARRTFVRKEYGMTKLQSDTVADDLEKQDENALLFWDSK